MPTTTYAAIRDAQISAIEALTPQTHSAAKFNVTRGVNPQFRAEAEQNPQASFRRFAIDLIEHTPEGVTNLDLEMTRVSAELVMAYPHEMSLYGANQERDLHTTLEQDMVQIAKTIGTRGYANYTSGQHACYETWSVEPGDAVTFGVMSLDLIYDKDAS